MHENALVEVIQLLYYLLLRFIMYTLTPFSWRVLNTVSVVDLFCIVCLHMLFVNHNLCFLYYVCDEKTTNHVISYYSIYELSKLCAICLLHFCSMFFLCMVVKIIAFKIFI